MRWWRWWQTVSTGQRARSEGRARTRGPIVAEDVRAALSARGVPDAFIAPLVERVVASDEARSPETFAALLDGIAMALELQRSTQARLSESLRGLREVERMMGAFSGELSKLDEVLGVLAAYVRRMKSSGAAPTDRTLH
jgi:hypothetical protein